jgi:hypothetical protein
VNESKNQRTVTANFIDGGATVHCRCFVERQSDNRLLLRILAELGKTSLAGLAGEERGELEIDNFLIPFRVLRVRFPYVDVLAFPHRAHPVQRQFLRIPATFSIRLRRQGSHGLWISGQGIELSAGGCSFLLAQPYVPNPRMYYDIDMLLTLPQSGEVHPLFNGEICWIRPASRHITTGVEIHNPGQRRLLAMAASEIQQGLTRRHV